MTKATAEICNQCGRSVKPGEDVEGACMACWMSRHPLEVIVAIRVQQIWALMKSILKERGLIE